MGKVAYAGFFVYLLETLKALPRGQPVGLGPKPLTSLSTVGFAMRNSRKTMLNPFALNAFIGK